MVVNREARREINARSEDRHHLSNERAWITYDGADIEVELTNISGGGATVISPVPLKIWDKVELHLGNHGTIGCAVRWIRDDRIGLEFTHDAGAEVLSNELATVLRHVIERTFPHITLAKRKR